MTETPIFGTVDTDRPGSEEARIYAEDGIHSRRAAEPKKTLSVFDELKEEADRELESFVTYENTVRPGWFMRFSTTIDAKDIRRYEAHARGTGKKRRAAEDSDLIKGNAVMLADKCVAILRGGTDDEHIVVDPEHDEEITFTSEAFVDLFADSTGTVQSALQKFLGDAQLMKLAGSLLSEAGYDEEMQPVDPTNG
ncbi:hypothetical protein SEA_SICARIUS2_18 [Arthrobacter phage Sicarius2]|uniref:Uncharacterized protein n=1 Tax=Arthrobacter phage Sicarius2 TaxID=2836090 RepID=A0A8F3INI1_9CAUD|nr:hypothetical protein SEA_SICARIUS2_18 [Arthrobacter phage Sicarius2]